MPLNAFLWIKSIFQSSWGLGMVLFLSGSFQLLCTTKPIRACLVTLQIPKWRFEEGRGRKTAKRRERYKITLFAQSLFTNVLPWGQIHMRDEPWGKTSLESLYDMMPGQKLDLFFSPMRLEQQQFKNTPRSIVCTFWRASLMSRSNQIYPNLSVAIYIFLFKTRWS